MFITTKETGVVLYVGTVQDVTNELGLPVYKTPEASYAAFCHELYMDDVAVVPYKNTYIDGVVGINPEWIDPTPSEDEKTQLDRIEEQVNKIAEGNVDQEYVDYYNEVNAALNGGV